MWKEYSKDYRKNNRTSSISIMASAFIAALFISFLCSTFYNAWKYDVEQIILEEGDWQARISGDINEEKLGIIQNFANVDRVIINENLSEELKVVVDIYFHNKRTIFRDMPLLITKLGLKEEEVSYHNLLLSKYLIHDPQDTEPPLLMSFYLAVLIIVTLSLVLIIRNAFAVSMGARIRQFGIFSSIGATPRQTLICMIQEALALCTVPILTGSVLGIAGSLCAIRGMDIIAVDVSGRHALRFQYHPFVLVVTILISASTILLSVWIPARKLSRITPLEAIQGSDIIQLKREHNPRILSKLFGVEGELAGNAIKLQRKTLRTSSLSLTLSFLGFAIMLCFFSFTGISTRHTYFERYQEVWDEMVTIKNTKIEEFNLADRLYGVDGAEDVIIYQKAESEIMVSDQWQSDELTDLGGLGAVVGESLPKKEGQFVVKAPLVIMDDKAFQKYCEQIGIKPRLDGVIILNQIWDSLNSNFRYPKYIPFVRENRERIAIQTTRKDQKPTEVPVIGYTKEVPVLREEYDDNTLVQFIPLSFWKKISGQAENVESDTYVRILAREGAALEDLYQLERNITQCLGDTYEIECENRIQEKITNDKIIGGYQWIIGAFCALLALIGVVSVFSNTLGFVHQRKREFAQYMSVGLTPAGMRKMFFIEALIISVRPILISMPLIVMFEVFATKASHLKLTEVLSEFPAAPILIFCLVIFAFVTLSYAIGAGRLMRCQLSEALRNNP